MASYIDKEKARNTVAYVLDKIQSGEDLLQLGDYYRLFKKEVSLFNRSKVAAYLLMVCDQGKTQRFAHERDDFARAEHRGPRPARDNRPARDDRPARAEDAQRYPPLPEEESKRLFFSVGRSRRVFPREILGLISTQTSVAREDIGGIRILDNYSFVQVRDTVAETIIESLNGKIFRGRPLTVNYAKSRRDEENETAASEQDEGHSDEEDI